MIYKADIKELHLVNIDDEYLTCLGKHLGINFNDSDIKRLYISEYTVDLIMAIIAVHNELPKEYCKVNTDKIVDNNFDVIIAHFCNIIKSLSEYNRQAFLACLSPQIQTVLALS